ncbi:MAG: ion transporter [Magnetococcales bacterium]|nr:ion transporter [Magnetococcales bacterium]
MTTETPGTHRTLGQLNPIWNYSMLLGIAWYGFSVPIEIALRLDMPLWSHGLDFILSILFMVDILILFRTPFFKGHELISDPVAIRRHYLKNRCLLDIIATIPWDFVMWSILPADLIHAEVIIWLRMLRLLRLFRVPSIVADLPATPWSMRSTWKPIRRFGSTCCCSGSCSPSI